jgi:hypothetical protein
MASCGRRFSHLTDMRSPDMSKEPSAASRQMPHSAEGDLAGGLQREERRRDD